MSKIDWTKPIETKDGKPATLLSVLSNNKYRFVVVVTDTTGEEHASVFDDDGCHQFVNDYIRNVPPAPALVLYGRLEPWKPGDTEGLGWTPHQGKSDTHIITLTYEDLKRVMRPLNAQEYHDA